MKQRCIINGINVDLEALLGVEYSCVPSACANQACCCQYYEITLTADELQTVLGMVPMAAKYAAHLDVSADELPELFEEIDDGQFALAEDEDGCCVFQYQNGDGATLCSIHSAALEHGMHPYRVKPWACSMWPLTEDEEDPPLLTLQDDALDFPCNRQTRTTRRELCPELQDIIQAMYGEDFLRQIQQAAERQGD